MLPPTPTKTSSCLNYTSYVKFPLLRLLKFLSDLKSTIFMVLCIKDYTLRSLHLTGKRQRKGIRIYK